MPIKAKTFVSLIVALGGLALVCDLWHWQSGDLAGFAVYFVITVLASGWKMRLPGVTGTMSVCFFFLLMGIVSRSLPEVLLAGVTAALVQYIWQSAKRLTIVQILFNVATVSLAISASYAVFHSAWLRSLPLELAVLLAILACTYFAANTFPIATIIALTEGKSFWGVWRTCYLWSFPYYLLGAACAGFFDVAKRYLGWQTSMLILPVIYLIHRSYGLHLRHLEDEKKHAEERAALLLRTVESLALAIEAKDHTTHDHLQRVQVYAMEIGKELRLSEGEMEALRAASLLHDIGKIAVPEHIISKPGKLTPEEFEKMKVHPVVGAEILSRAQFPYPVVPIVRSHHEKWDGSGYPDGLKGEEIPIGARILSAVDCLDALASDRQYRRAMPIAKAMEIVTSEAGKAFDPRVVELLARRYLELEALARSQPMETLNLSTDVKIERGLAPAAGFEKAGTSVTAAPKQKSGAVHQAIRPLKYLLSAKELWIILASRLESEVPFETMAVYTRQGEQLVPGYLGGKNASSFDSLRIPVGEGLSGWVAKNNKPVLNGNPAVESGDADHRRYFHSMRSALSVPLSGREGTEVLTLYRAEPDAFTREELRVLMALSADLAQPMESAASRQPAARSFQRTAEETLLPV